MTRGLFEQELERIQSEVFDFGMQTANKIVAAVEILRDRDIEAAHQLIEADAAINAKRHRLENELFVLIATQQPMAGDLRKITAMVSIVTELERMCDYAKSLAKLNLRIGDEALIVPVKNIPLMGYKARNMLNTAMTAFGSSDIALAGTVPDLDEEVDQLYDDVFRTLMDYVIADPQRVAQANYLTMAAYTLERTADRVINICEQVIYMVTGEIKELDPTEHLPETDPTD